MGWWNGGASRLRSLGRRGREEAELDEEVRFHLEQETAKLLRQGWAPDEARREAYRRFGGVERMKERTRDARGTRWLEDAVRDLRYAARGLRRAPGFTAVAVLTLGLGIGATTAMFSLVDGVLLRGLPYPDAQRVMAVWERNDEGASLHASYLNFADWRREAESFEALAAYTPPSPVTVLGPAGGARSVVTRVSQDFFRVGGVAPFLGRLPGPDEHAEGGPPVAVASHRFWLEALGGPADLAGVTVSVQGLVHDVVGVMPPGFDLPAGPDLWLSLDRAVPWSVRANHVVRVVGRLAPGGSAALARQELDRIHAGIRAQAPEVETAGVLVRPLQEEFVGSARQPLILLLGAAGFLLLVACGNVATTFLARGAGRTGEMGLRASLGAGRGRLVRQLVMESTLLAALGAGAALVVARGIVWATRWVDPAAVPRLAGVTLDGRVLGFALVTALATVVAFGLAPALRLTAGDLVAASRSGRAGADRRHRATWRLLMAGEVALAVVLLAGAGLLLRNLAAILDRDLGYDPDGVVTASLHLPAEKFQTAAQAVAFLEGLAEGVHGTPEVDEVGFGLMLPIRGTGSLGGPVLLDGGVRTDAVFQYRVADAGYFRALGVPLLEGRLFGPGDGADAPHVAVIDAAMARALWPDESAVGQRFDPGGMDPYRDQDLTVVGVVGEVRDWSQGPGDSPTYYVHLPQRPAFAGMFGLNMVVHGGSPAAVADAIRTQVRQRDPDVPVQTAVLRSRLADSAGDRRFTAFVLGGFALAALLLAVVGIYGVVSYAVARRTREMGVRLALGARPAQVRGAAQADALGTVAVGAAVGLGGAILLSRTLGSLLVGVGSLDPVAYLGGVALLLAAAWVASWIPARRATRVNPVQALRQE